MIRWINKYQDNPRCSYCANHVTNTWTESWALNPVMYGCDRWWCKILRKVKIPVITIEFKKMINPHPYNEEKQK